MAVGELPSREEIVQFIRKNNLVKKKPRARRDHGAAIDLDGVRLQFYAARDIHISLGIPRKR